ncbi:hypothetical protein [Streptomyces sp. LN500]|uniref:hypothetical protein n=1 Tax=Streptomyces sp. LN500 TaxID=3112978 RepID=UPI00371F61D2
MPGRSGRHFDHQALPHGAVRVTGARVALLAAEIATGADPAAARNRARLGLATVRGLLLDLLATGDRDGVNAAMEDFLRLYYGSK